MQQPAPSSGAVVVEACVETLPEALAAADAGAHRLELCAGLVEGGTTPSAGLIAAVVEQVAVPVFVMVRARGGDFMYDDHDIDVMRRDVTAARSAGAHGIVGGMLTAGGQVDPRVTRLIETAGPLPFTFHRAFDLARDPERALDDLAAMGVARVLTSGGEPSAIEGTGRLAALVTRAGGRLTIVAGGGVRAPHVRDIVRRSGVREVHARPVRPSRHFDTAAVRGIRLGNALPAGDSRVELDPDALRALVAALTSIGRG